jgi:hypothetical protein
VFVGPDEVMVETLARTAAALADGASDDAVDRRDEPAAAEPRDAGTDGTSSPGWVARFGRKRPSGNGVGVDLPPLPRRPPTAPTPVVNGNGGSEEGTAQGELTTVGAGRDRPEVQAAYPDPEVHPHAKSMPAAPAAAVGDAASPDPGAVAGGGQDG